ncbi:hypothetical protein SEPCBS57363_006131 [Sporothrix epigloea]|uniref:DUF7704 domain-containing protein n=1 Tax=Sporothrix epigloea TaxID=1892477 RepID=A0ABP0E4J2_9PEZI
MASRLPAVPRVVFTVIEPISLLGGCVPALFAAGWFIREQIAEAAPTPAVAPSDQAHIVAQQLGNAYGLLFMIGVAVLYTSTELKVVRNYLVALLIADIGHVGLTIAALGPDRFAAIGEWNAMTWGNVGFTIFLALMRTSYLLGFFGPDKPLAVSIYEKQK